MAKKAWQNLTIAEKIKRVKIRKLIFNISFFVVAFAAFGTVLFIQQQTPIDVTLDPSVIEAIKIKAFTTKLAGWITMPILFTGFAAMAVLKDETKKAFPKLPKGVDRAILLFVFALLARIITQYILFATGAYLVASIVNVVYFDGMIANLERLEAQNHG